MSLLGLIGLTLASFTLLGFALFGNLNTDSSAPAGAGTNKTTAPSTHPYAPQPGAQETKDGLAIKVVGKCTDKGGLRLQSSGFTPNGEYVTTAKFPDGTNYPYLPQGGIGKADENGATPDWRWDCINTPGGFGSQHGTYTITLTDRATGKSVSAQFMPWIPTGSASPGPSTGASN